jgi:hypothetical protein
MECLEFNWKGLIRIAVIRIVPQEKGEYPKGIELFYYIKSSYLTLSPPLKEEKLLGKKSKGDLFFWPLVFFELQLSIANRRMSCFT